MTIVSEPRCCAPTGDRCGEGVLWHPDEQAVYWTDINRFLAHRYNPQDQSVKSWYFEEPVTAILLTDKAGTLAVCLGSKIILWEPASDARCDIGFHLPNWPAVRLNDAAVDSRGSIWVGSMRNNVNPDGSEGEAGGTDGILYRIDPDGAVSDWERHLGISNTFAWSPDNHKLYFGDTMANVIWAYDYSPQTGAVAKVRPHLAGFARGVPDGSSIDEDGYLWNCRWNGSCIVRVSPDGIVDRLIEMPTRNITNCTFGGRDLNILYVTSAASPSDHGDRLAGSLFSIETSVHGLPENRFRVTN